MASDLDRISEAFRLLATVAFPENFLGDMECAMVNAHLDATKATRARKLLAERGPDFAATAMCCSRRQVYRLARAKVSDGHKTGTPEAEHP